MARSSGDPEDVQVLLNRACEWASTRSDVRALALVGSWARDDSTHGSDVDLVLLVDEPARYLRDDSWAKELGATLSLRTESWGAVTERRLALPSGLEIDVGITSLSWAATEPVDAGTARVVSDGIRILFDPDGLLARLAAAVSG